MIGICVVYLASSDNQHRILELSISQIRENTNSKIQIYGVVPNNNEETINALSDLNVKLIDPPDRRIRPQTAEHSSLLDSLIYRATLDGCEYIAAFDMDSWPVHRGWDDFYRKYLSSSRPLVSIVRTEMGDNFPHPSFFYFPTSFWKATEFSVGLNRELDIEQRATDYSTRPVEAGSGLLAAICEHNLSFGYIERSNEWNFHNVLGAMYGNSIFHLGALSRDPVFFTDPEVYGLNGDPVRDKFAAHSNRSIQRFAVEQILSRHDEFIDSISSAGGPLAPRIATRENILRIAREARTADGATNCAGVFQGLHQDGRALADLRREKKSLQRTADATTEERDRLRRKLAVVKSEKNRVTAELEKATRSFNWARRYPIMNLLRSWRYKIKKCNKYYKIVLSLSLAIITLAIWV